MKSQSHSSGFGLIELMICLVIMSILMAIAWPQYQSYVVNTRRTVATACLMEGAQFMERFYTMNLRYDQTTGGAGVVLPQTQCATQLEKFYTFSISKIDKSSYTLSAQPKGQQATKDSKCGTLSLNEKGLQQISGDGDVKVCW